MATHQNLKLKTPKTSEKHRNRTKVGKVSRSCRIFAMQRKIKQNSENSPEKSKGGKVVTEGIQRGHSQAARIKGRREDHVQNNLVTSNRDKASAVTCASTATFQHNKAIQCRRASEIKANHKARKLRKRCNDESHRSWETYHDTDIRAHRSDCVRPQCYHKN